MNVVDSDAVKIARAASNANRRRALEAENALYHLMLVIDNCEACEHDLRRSEEWKSAAHVLGWDIDWAELAERRLR